jgi:hypothetical protein
MAYSEKAEAILALTDASYDEYNTILPVIKKRIVAWDFIGYKRVGTFEQVLEKVLLDNTARRAYRIAILVAVGEMEEPGKPGFDPKPRKSRGKPAPRAN